MAALGLSLALAGTAVAGGHPSGKSSSSGGYSHGMTYSNGHNSSPSYHPSYGSKFSGGSYYFKGKDQHFWSYRSFENRYGCYCYWYPTAGCYYYYCQPDDCYYPVDYCPYGKYCW